MPQVLCIVALSWLACVPGAARESGQSLPLAGQYVLKLSLQDTIEGGDMPENALRLAAFALWGSDEPLAAVLADNGVADRSTLKFGDVLRVPPPKDTEGQTNFAEGLSLALRLRGGGTLHVACDPCHTLRNDELDEAHGLALRITDERGKALRVPLIASVEAGGDAARHDGELLDLRAWDLPGGDVLLAVKTQSESGGAHYAADGRLALFRLGPGPEVQMLQAIVSDGGASAGNGGSEETVTLHAALEDARFVITAARHRTYYVGEAKEAGKVHTRTGDSFLRQRMVYSTADRLLVAELEREVSRRHKAWAEGEPVPEAYVEDPVQP